MLVKHFFSSHLKTLRKKSDLLANIQVIVNNNNNSVLQLNKMH